MPAFVKLEPTNAFSGNILPKASSLRYPATGKVAEYLFQKDNAHPVKVSVTDCVICFNI